jgi:gluconate 2-dehydrogenase gamma chain
MLNSMDRRDFLKGAGGTVAIASMPVMGATVQRSLASGCKFFTVPQAALVESIADQMIPADESPGGKAAGVVFYIDGVLAGPFGKFYRTSYEEGLAMIDATSQKQFGGAFVSVSSDRQAELLQILQSGHLQRESGPEFFGLLWRHIMEGYYGDPSHGGNRDGASWKMIGFEGEPHAEH